MTATILASLSQDGKEVLILERRAGAHGDRFCCDVLSMGAGGVI